MSEEIPLHRILFLDIETAPAFPGYQEMDPAMQRHWDSRAKYLMRSTPSTSEELYFDRAGIYAEFARVVCIGMGIFTKQGTFRLHAIHHEEEERILREFKALLDKHYHEVEHSWICGHNIREFDIPFLCRRMLIHGIRLPNILSLSGKKAWQVPQLIDTMDMWKFGDQKHFVSLDLLATVLSIPSPKDKGISGKDVAHVFWREKDIDRIVAYCLRDVKTTAKIYLRLSQRTASVDFGEEEE